MEKNKNKKDKVKYRKRKLALRIVISILLIVFFASSIDLKETLSIILGSNYLLLLLCILLYLVGQSISAYKWSIISKAIGFQRKFSEYIQFYYIGMFFNLFLPTTIGGDVGKAYYLSKGCPQRRKAPAIYTVLAERFSGLAVLAWIGTIALFTPFADKIPALIKYFALFLSVFIVVGAPLFPVIIKNFFSKSNWLNRSMLKDIAVFWDVRLAAKCLGWSLLFHCIIIVIHMLIGLSIDLPINPMYFCAVYPIVAIIGFLPISFNGIGVREGAYIYFFLMMGVNKSAGLAFGILWFSILVIASLIGGVVYIKGHHSRPPDEYDTSDFDLETTIYSESGELGTVVTEQVNQDLISNS